MQGIITEELIREIEKFPISEKLDESIEPHREVLRLGVLGLSQGAGATYISMKLKRYLQENHFNIKIYDLGEEDTAENQIPDALVLVADMNWLLCVKEEELKRKLESLTLPFCVVINRWESFQDKEKVKCMLGGTEPVYSFLQESDLSEQVINRFSVMM